MRGFAIHEHHARPTREQVARIATLPTAIVSDNMHRLFGCGAALRPLRPGTALCGPAFTVRTRPGDNLMIHKALDIARSGDVIVADGGGELANALIGEIMWRYAERRGLRGFVIDGAVRDVAVLSAGGGLPVFARGTTHRGPYKDGPGEIGTPIVVGGMAVAPGDIVLGDDDGVLAIPLAEADAIAGLAEAQQAREAEILEAIAADRLDRAWIDHTLIAKGVLPPR